MGRKRWGSGRAGAQPGGRGFKEKEETRAPGRDSWEDKGSGIQPSTLQGWEDGRLLGPKGMQTSSHSFLRASGTAPPLSSMAE